MNVSLSFPNEIEAALRQQASARGVDIATFVQEIVAERLYEVQEETTETPPSGHSLSERLQSLIRLHPPSNGQVDDSRESIYAGRDA